MIRASFAGNNIIYPFIIFALLITSCKKSDDNSSEGKFGGIEHALSDMIADYKRVEFLIKRVHNKSWNIVYGFGCDSVLCSKSKVPYKDKKLLTPEEKIKHKRIASYVESRISWALETWLVPIRKLDLGIETISKRQFKFIELTPKPDKLSSSGFIYTPNQFKAADLMVIIGGGVSYAHPERVLELFSEPASIPPFVYMRHDNNITYTTSNTSWEYLLLHELGHAFGLVDTYPDAITGTIGQSASVMNLELRDYQTPPTLASDDIKGMEWLYYFYHDRQKLKGNECLFDDYEIMKNNKEETFCRPIYPVIHEIKQAYFKDRHGNATEAKGFMVSAIKISDDLKNKKDKDGRTALHYAVMHEGESVEMKTDWRQMIKSLLASGFDRKIKDKAGKTACDYLQCKESGGGTKTEIKCSEIRKLLCQ